VGPELVTRKEKGMDLVLIGVIMVIGAVIFRKLNLWSLSYRPDLSLVVSIKIAFLWIVIVLGFVLIAIGILSLII
jgi:hypothetical protein